MFAALSSQDARSVIRLACLGVAVRLAVPAFVYLAIGHLNEYSTTDSKQYLRLAVALLTTGRYQTDGQPEVYRPPAYVSTHNPG